MAVLQGIFGEWLGTTHVLLPYLLCKRERWTGISKKLYADVHLSVFSTCKSCYYFALRGPLMPSVFHTRLSVALRALLYVQWFWGGDCCRCVQGGVTHSTPRGAGVSWLQWSSITHTQWFWCSPPCSSYSLAAGFKQDPGSQSHVPWYLL